MKPGIRLSTMDMLFFRWAKKNNGRGYGHREALGPGKMVRRSGVELNAGGKPIWGVRFRADSYIW